MSTDPVRVTSALPIISTDEISKTGTSVVYWGPSLSGKTHCGLTWPGPFVIQWDTNSDTLEKFPHIPYIRPGIGLPESRKNWTPVRHFITDIVPAIQNRKLTELVRQMPGFEDYKVETVFLDSFTSMAMAIKHDWQGSAGNKMGYDGWENYLTRLTDWTVFMVGATKPDAYDPNKECYNFVASVHETLLTNDAGNVIDVKPSVQGAFQAHMLGHFENVFFTKCIPEDQKARDGVLERVAKYWIYTVPPDSWRVCGDRIGGGRYKKLPAKMGGTYLELAKAWGLENAK
jgi:hypothetical protein